MKDYYKILRINKNATGEEIKKAYKGLAKIYHPDINRTGQSSESIFAEINEAHAILSDPIERKNYDNMIANDGKVQTRNANQSNEGINSILNKFDDFKF